MSITIEYIGIAVILFLIVAVIIFSIIKIVHIIVTHRKSNKKFQQKLEAIIRDKPK